MQGMSCPWPLGPLGLGPLADSKNSSRFQSQKSDQERAY